MKTIKMILVSVPFIIFSGCNGQTPKGNNQLFASKKDKEAISDTLNKPQINVKVNKQYDDKGRIIKFDSTYSYFYSSPGGSLQQSNDIVYSQFRSFFDQSYPDFFNHQNDNIFFNDSFFKYDFYNNDYFQKRFELNRKMFERMYQQMDSLKWNYLQDNYPKGHQKKKKICLIK
jgi:hypothetical protein